MPHRLPVTVISGFPGSGKTALVNHLLEAMPDRRLAVIVNDPSDIHLDPLLEAVGQRALLRVPARLMRRTSGCVLCTLREDLLREIERLALGGRCDYVLVESNGLAEPLRVAETFSCRDGAGHNLAEVARLDGLVTVVDARGFMEGFPSHEKVPRLTLGPEAEKQAVAELLSRQVEFANVLVVNKTDQVNAVELRALKELLRQLNPDAWLIYATHGRVPPDALLEHFWYDLGPAARLPGWVRSLRGDLPAESGVYHFRSFIYRTPTPFHPARLAAHLNTLPWSGLLRSRGFAWLASQPEIAWQWSQAGRVFDLAPAGKWWTALPAGRRPLALGLANGAWHPELAERRQELVFIGRDMAEGRIREHLDACLLTANEMALGETAWRQLPGPCPPTSSFDTVPAA